MILMDSITSRKNRIVCHLRSLAGDAEYRKHCREYVCDGEKTLREALAFGAEINCVLWNERPTEGIDLPKGTEQYTAPGELYCYASPLKSGSGPVFSVKIPDKKARAVYDRVIVLENLQDPGNVGTVLRTANAFGIDAVILVGACADLYNPKTVRASMGAIFRQEVLCMDIDELSGFLTMHDLPLYGAALSDAARDIRELELHRSAVAIGSEGSGLSEAILSVCKGSLIIPMRPDSESLNAAIAASVVMWEMSR